MQNPESPAIFYWNLIYQGNMYLKSQGNFSLGILKFTRAERQYIVLCTNFMYKLGRITHCISNKWFLSLLVSRECSKRLGILHCVSLDGTFMVYFKKLSGFGFRGRSWARRLSNWSLSCHIPASHTATICQVLQYCRISSLLVHICWHHCYLLQAHISTVIDKIGTTADKTEWTLNVRINVVWGLQRSCAGRKWRWRYQPPNTKLEPSN